MNVTVFHSALLPSLMGFFFAHTHMDNFGDKDLNNVTISLYSHVQ